ncbi:SEC-C domain-containing protein [Planomicrobium okeanokoites]|uniref:SEC-C domain-containing protein n=1 Tax=Planomicrobium okeanokoites TaxID=244 RepID=UPI002493CF11|nr:SEC-C domain-containing protein [Planomicrobium okeanokoites]
MYDTYYSKNDTCPCGSGKRFKKCCSTSSIKIPTGKKIKSINKQPANTHEIVLDKLNMIIREASSLRPSDQVIKKITYELYNLKNKGKLTKNEYRLIKSVAFMNVIEYVQLDFDKVPDYGAMKVFFEFTYQAIEARIPDEKQYYSAIVQVAPNATLASWKFTDSSDFSEDSIDITWQDVSPSYIVKESSKDKLQKGEVMDNFSTPYRFDQGLQEFIAGYLDLILMGIKESSQKWFIEDLIKDISNFSSISDPIYLEKLKKPYLKEVEITLEVREASNNQRQISYGNAEGSIKSPYNLNLFTKLKIVDFTINEVKKYINKQENAQSRETILLYLDFTINILFDHFSIEEFIKEPFIVLFIDELGVILDFTVTESNYMTRIETLNFQNNLNQEFINEKEMSRPGQMLFETAKIMDSLIPTEKEIDFSPFCLNFFTSLENELNYYYGKTVKKVVPSLKSRVLTIGSFVRAFNEMLVTDNNNTLKLSKEFLVKLEWAKDVRNLTAHPEPISFKKYQEVRSLFLNDKFINEVLNLDIEVTKSFLYTDRLKESLLNNVLDVTIEKNQDAKLKVFKSKVFGGSEVIRKLEATAELYFKVPFQRVFPIMADRILKVDMDNDSLGYLMLVDNFKNKQGFWAHQFDYAGNNIFGDKLELHFGNMLNDIRGKIGIEKETNGNVSLKGDAAAKKMKLLVLMHIFKSSMEMDFRLNAILEEIENELLKVDSTEVVDFISRLKDFYLLILGINENKDLRNSNTYFLEKFLTICLKHDLKLALKQEDIISVVKEILKKDFKKEKMNTLNIRKEKENILINISRLETINEFVLEINSI